MKIYLLKLKKLMEIFSNIGDQKEITFLNVIDKKISYVKIMILKCMQKK